MYILQLFTNQKNQLYFQIKSSQDRIRYDLRLREWVILDVYKLDLRVGMLQI